MGYSAPKIPTAGENIEQSVWAYTNNQDALRDAGRADANTSFGMSALGMTGVDPAQAAWNNDLEQLYQQSGQGQSRSNWIADASAKNPQDARFNQYRESSSYAGVMEGLAPRMDQITADSNTRQRENDIRDVMGDAYDPTKSMAENVSAIDRNANPELYAAVEGISNVQTPDLTTPNWADANAYGLSNRDLLSTTAWNRFDQGADAMMNRAGPNFTGQTRFDQNADALRGQDMPNFTGYNRFDQNEDVMRGRAGPNFTGYNRFDQNEDTMRGRALPNLNQSTGTQNLDYKNWATDAINNQVYNAQGVNYATADRNQIFNYSPEADRARQITGQQLSDGGGENMAYAYGQAQNMMRRGTGVGQETQMRDNLLSSLGTAGRNINAGNVGLNIDNTGDISDAEAARLAENSREAFSARGRVRDDSAVLGELADREEFRRSRRMENNTNFMNQANVGLANAQNQLQARIASGQQGLQGLGMQGSVINDRFNDRMASDDSYNRRGLETIGALSATDAQRFNNFQQGVNANMGIDQDYQNRVDRYVDTEMRQGAYNSDQTNNWINQLGGVDDRYQGVQRYNNDLAAQQAAFGNQAMISQDALAAGRLGEYERANQNWMTRQGAQEAADAGRLGEYERANQNWMARQGSQEAARAGRLGEYERANADWMARQGAQEGADAARVGEYQNASNQWNQRMAIDDAAARQRMNDYQGISSDWQQRQQQDYANQMQQGLSALGAWQGMRQDPWSAITGRNSPNINTNANAWAQGNPQAQAGNMGFADVFNLNNSLTNLGINSQNQTTAANANVLGAGLGALGSIGGAMAMMCWWARAVYGVDNPKWLVFRHYIIHRAPKWFFKLYCFTGPRYAHIAKNPIIRSILKPFMDRIINRELNHV